MNLYERCRKNKQMIIALKSLCDECAVECNLDLNGTISDICRNAGANRTQIYERKIQLKDGLKEIEIIGPGRPVLEKATCPHPSVVECELEINILRYRLENPGAFVRHNGNRVGYSDGFRRHVLDLFDTWEGGQEKFCRIIEVPFQTFMTWKRLDAQKRIEKAPKKSIPVLGPNASQDAVAIVENYAVWQGSLRDFLPYESKRLYINPNQIRRVLIITGMLTIKSGKAHRYRGATERIEPGQILVTDGKDVKVVFTSSGKEKAYNWQGIVDQTTTCHTATVVTKNEDAQGVSIAYHKSIEFIGRVPCGLLHDNKPIYSDKELREDIEKRTVMIPATLKRPENKADIEGEFGKYEQYVGTIRIDDQNQETLGKSIVKEVIRAYTEGINHAGRFEFGGKSRLEVLREACPDPEKNKAFIEHLKGRHDLWKKQNTPPTFHVARALLDEGFKRFDLEGNDPKGSLRNWLASTNTPEAIRQGFSIFGAKREMGLLNSKNAHRYLVKVIQNCQNDIDLRIQEKILRELAEVERASWLNEFEQDFEKLSQECRCGDVIENDLAFRLSECAAFGSIIIEREFWLDKLKMFLQKQPDRIRAVCRHIRRLFEVDSNDRFQLISKLILWEHGLTG